MSKNDDVQDLLSLLAEENVDAAKGKNKEVITKEVVNAGMDASLETGLLLERKTFEVLFDSEDQKEGMQAFIEKRRPAYKGK